MRRVAKRQVILLFEPWDSWQFWLVEYFPDCLSLPSEVRAPGVEDVQAHLDVHTVVPVPVPADCIDGFAGSYWRRPEAYLDPSVRAGISSLAQLSPRSPRGASEGCGKTWNQANGMPVTATCGNSRKSTLGTVC